jgi:hypothetical protein
MRIKTHPSEWSLRQRQSTVVPVYLEALRMARHYGLTVERRPPRGPIPGGWSIWGWGEIGDVADLEIARLLCHADTITKAGLDA